MARNTEPTIYYYFKLRNGVEYAIKESVIEINTNIMRNYRELTAEQREFHLANPTATVQEVVNCQLTAPFVPPTPDVSDYAAEKIKALKEACLETISVSTIEYAMANACLAGTSLTYNGRQHYTTTQAKAIMKTFMDESDAAMDVFEQYKPLIEEASTLEDIDVLYSNAIAQLDS